MLAKRTFLGLLACGLAPGVYAQTTGSVGIGTATPEPSAALEVRSASKGLLPPRLTRQQRDNMPAPLVAGLLIYQTDDTPGIYQYTGSGWVRLVADNLGDHAATQNLRLNGHALSNNGGAGLWFDNAGAGTFDRGARIAGRQALELGAGVAGKEANAGKIGYQTFSDGLDIVGAGVPGARRVSVFSEGGAQWYGTLGVTGGVRVGDDELGAREENAGTIAYQKFSGGLDIVGAGSDATNRKVTIHSEAGTSVNGPVTAKAYRYERPQVRYANIPFNEFSRTSSDWDGVYYIHEKLPLTKDPYGNRVPYALRLRTRIDSYTRIEEAFVSAPVQLPANARITELVVTGYDNDGQGLPMKATLYESRVIPDPSAIHYQGIGAASLPTEVNANQVGRSPLNHQTSPDNHYFVVVRMSTADNLLVNVRVGYTVSEVL